MWALAAALAGAIGYGAGSVLQAAGAARARGPAVLWHPAFLLGLTLDGFAWLASLVAVRQLPLFAVQSILAGSIAVTVVLASIFLGASLGMRHWIAIAGVLTGLIAVAVASGLQSAQASPNSFTTFAMVGLGVVAALSALLYRRRAPVSMAVIAGVAFSGAAVCARALDGSGDWQQLFSQPVVWAVLGFGLVGMVAYARSLEVGAVGTVTAILWVVEVVVAGAIGVFALGDTVRPGWLATAIGGVVLAIGACVVLATGPTQDAGGFRCRAGHDPRTATPVQKPRWRRTLRPRA